MKYITILGSLIIIFSYTSIQSSTQRIVSKPLANRTIDINLHKIYTNLHNPRIMDYRTIETVTTDKLSTPQKSPTKLESLPKEIDTLRQAKSTENPTATFSKTHQQPTDKNLKVSTASDKVIDDQIVIAKESLKPEEQTGPSLLFMSNPGTVEHEIPTLTENMQLDTKTITLQIIDCVNSFSKKMFEVWTKQALVMYVKHHLPKNILANIQKNGLSIPSINAVMKLYLLQLLGMSNSSIEKANPSLKKFKKQLQFLSDQIKSYNDQTIYTNATNMLSLIEYIHQFVKENNIIYVSPAMHTKLDAILENTKNLYYIFNNQNIILSSDDAPEKVLEFFNPVIDTINHLSNIIPTIDLMHTIYDAHGYIDQVLQTWQDFTTSELYLTPANRQYAAFISFLLIFEYSMIAAAILLNETSLLYKVTNPIPVIINIG